MKLELNIAIKHNPTRGFQICIGHYDVYETHTEKDLLPILRKMGLKHLDVESLLLEAIQFPDRSVCDPNEGTDHVADEDFDDEV